MVSVEENLENLVQLIGIKNHVDYCLEKLEPILNNENTEDNNQDNENEDWTIKDRKSWLKKKSFQWRTSKRLMKLVFQTKLYFYFIQTIKLDQT